MAINIYHATSMDALARGLGEVINAAGLGPFDQEIVVVPDRGIQRWLDQMLSHQFADADGQVAGISAGIDYRRAGNLAELFLGREDDWNVVSLAWRIISIVVNTEERAGFGPFATRDPSYRQAKQVAELFLKYAAHRPAMLRAWLAGEPSSGERDGESLHPDLAWQVPLFQMLVEDVGDLPPVMRIGDALAEVKGAGTMGIHLFGRIEFSEADLELLGVIQEELDLFLWLVSPSPTQWGGGEHRRESVLLSVLGSQSENLADRLRSALPQARVNVLPGPEGHRQSLLARLQAGIYAGTQPVPGSQWDETVQIHSCFGPSRQVEALREVLTGIFEEHHDLEPRDVLVVCPNLNDYQPLFAATFSPESSHPGSGLRFHVPGVLTAGGNPLAELMLMVLDLARDRIRATELVDLLHRDEVKRRIRISDADVETLSGWIKDANIRWGFDEADRAEFKVPTNHNTIEFGLDRLALGVADASGDPLGETLPLGSVGSVDIDLLGTFMEFISRLRDGVIRLRQSTTAGGFGAVLSDLLPSIAIGDEGQEAHLSRLLNQILTYGDAPADVADIRALAADLADSSGGSISARTGGITVAPIGMMRGVRHKVICLIGMDEGALPRTVHSSGDDVFLRHPDGGRPDPHGQDRQVFLDTVTAADSHLVIMYSGIGENRGEERVAASPVAQLLDTLEVMTGERSVTTHPLHSFNRRYFTAGDLFSFDEHAARAAAVHDEKKTHDIRAGGAVPAELPDVLTLDEVKAFAQDPVGTFYKRRLGIAFVEEEAGLPTTIPLELSGLEKWPIGDEIVTQSAKTGWGEVEYSTQGYGGALPPGHLGEQIFDEVNQNAALITSAARGYAKGEADSYDVVIPLDGTTIRGRVGRVYGDTVAYVSYSRLKAKAKVAAWIDLLALKIQYPDRAWTAIVIGRGGEGAAQAVLSAPTAGEARKYLHQILDLYRKGMGEVLPLPVETAYEWVEKLHDVGLGENGRSQAKDAAEKAWHTTFAGDPKDDTDVHQRTAWGGVISLNELLSIPAAPEERWQGEVSRFGSLAMRLLGGMVEHVD